MKKRLYQRPIFFFEVIIGFLLIFLFSIYFLRSSIHCLSRDQQTLIELEFERLSEIKRMNILTAQWKNLHNIPSLQEQAWTFEEDISVLINGKKVSRKLSLCLFGNQNHPFYEVNIHESYLKKGTRIPSSYHFFIKL